VPEPKNRSNRAWQVKLQMNATKTLAAVHVSAGRTDRIDCGPSLLIPSEL